MVGVITQTTGDEGRQRNRDEGSLERTGSVIGEGWKPFRLLGSRPQLLSPRWLERADKGSDEGETSSITNDAILQLSEHRREHNGGEKPEMSAR